MPVAELNPQSATPINREHATKVGVRDPQSSSEVVVSVRGLTKVFKDFWNRPKARAVDNVDFDVRRGEVFGLLGPNGSGKSTTVKLLLGLLYPTKGHIEVFGHSPRHVQTKSRIGYLPEESYLYRYLNSRETLDFFGNLFHLSKSERNNRAEQLLEMVGLGKTMTRVVGEFSKGMQRRIGLAQALINDPDLVILDEPTSGLDPIGCREVKDLILALARRGKTVILSSHLLADVEDVCDRVVIYYGGKVQAMGTLKELLATPDTLRITTPVLPRETLERVLEIIRHDTATDRVCVDNPTQNLESYFLDVVQKARQAAAETSGSTSGARVAEYLRGGIEEKSATEKILERLALPETARPTAALRPVSQAELKADDKKLEALTKAAEPAPPPAKPAPAAERAQPVDLSKADEKLSSLLGKPK
ncbi:MAG: ABC transporter ATP-binding protein [Verrucomicrobiota bacterium]|jgi:ABC-2 type transport system ATP-binding protein